MSSANQSLKKFDKETLNKMFLGEDYKNKYKYLFGNYSNPLYSTTPAFASDLTNQNTSTSNNVNTAVSSSQHSTTKTSTPKKSYSSPSKSTTTKTTSTVAKTPKKTTVNSNQTSTTINTQSTAKVQPRGGAYKKTDYTN